MSIWKEPKNDYSIKSQVTPDIFNELAENERYLKHTQDTKITTAEVQNANIASVVYSSRTNIVDTEQLKIAIGKMRKWFADLSGLAFRDTVGNSEITDVNVSKIIGLHSVATSGNYNELSNKPSITKESIGLGNVANERQYSKSNIPPYPVTSVNGMTGAVTLPPNEVTASGTYPNMTVGNSQKLGGVESSRFVQIDSPIISGVKIYARKLNVSLSCTASDSKTYEVTEALNVEDFDPDKDIFYVTAFSGTGNNYWGDLGGGLSYRHSSYSLIARLNSCWQSINNLQATVHRGEMVFNQYTKKFQYTVFPHYRFYGYDTYRKGAQESDNHVVVDLYIIKFK